MEDAAGDIVVVGVDRGSIEMGAGKQSSWIVPFRLSAKPDQDWERKFYEVQQREKSALKRKAQILEDLLKVEVSETDDLQNILDVIKAQVAETNALREGDHQKKLKMRLELAALQGRQEDVTRKFRDAADKLSF